MSDSNLAVKITADIADLQVKFAVAKAEVAGMTSEINKLAKASAQGIIDPAGSARLQQLAGDMLAARTQAAGYSAELAKAGFATNTFAQAAEGGHGSISSFTREARALFDELSSGRTKQTPGTIAILLQRSLGLGPAMLGAVGGVVALTAGLAYLTVKAIEASRALDAAFLGAQFAGNLEISREAIKQFADEMSQAKGISGSDAREIAASLASIPGITTPVFHALTAEIADFAAQTGKTAPKAAEDLAKVFNKKTSAAEFARSIGGITQEQINQAEAADRSGDAVKQQAEKFSILLDTIGRSTTTIDENKNKITASIGSFFGYTAALASGTSAEEINADILARSNIERQKQLDILRQTAAELSHTKQSPEQTLKTGVQTAEKENPISRQVEEAKSKIAEMNAALAVADERGDEVSVEKLIEGLAKAKENLSTLQFGPVLERMREEMAKVAATWDGTQSGLLAKQIQISQATLADVQSNSKQRVQVETEIAHLQVQARQAAGSELIALARAEAATISGETGIGAIQRLEKERAVWVQTLTGDRLTAAQRLEVARTLNSEYAAINKETAAQASAIARSNADTDIAIAKLTIEAKKSTLELDVQAEKISAAQKYQILKDLVNQEFALNQQALQGELTGLNRGTAEYQRVLNQERELKAKQVLELAQLDKQRAAEVAKAAREEVTSWRSAVGEIENVEGTLVSNIINKRRGLSQTLLQVGGDLIAKEIANDVKATTTRMLLKSGEEGAKKALEQGGFLYHLVFDQKKTGTDVAGESARTSAATAGAATRQAAMSAAGIAAQAQQAATGPAMVMALAAQAAAGAFAATALIPYIGPELAPAAAALSYAEVAAFAPMAALATGTNYVPQDMVAKIHKGEAVIPKAFNPAAGGGDGGGGEVHLHLHAIDAASSHAWLKAPANRQAIADTLKTHFSRGGR